MDTDEPLCGILARAAGQALPVVVLGSRAGFYLGTRTEEGEPYSRESRQYWPTAEDAAKALETGFWTQRLCP